METRTQYDQDTNHLMLLSANICAGGFITLKWYHSLNSHNQTRCRRQENWCTLLLVMFLWTSDSCSRSMRAGSPT